MRQRIARNAKKPLSVIKAISRRQPRLNNVSRISWREKHQSMAAKSISIVYQASAATASLCDIFERKSINRSAQRRAASDENIISSTLLVQSRVSLAKEEKAAWRRNKYRATSAMFAGKSYSRKIKRHILTKRNNENDNLNLFKNARGAQRAIAQKHRHPRETSAYMAKQHLAINAHLQASARISAKYISERQ